MKQNGSSRAASVLQSLASVLLCVILFVSFAGGVLLWYCDGWLADPVSHHDFMQDTAYFDTAAEEIEKAIKVSLSLIPISPEDIIEQLDQTKLYQCSELAAKENVRKLFGEESVPVHFEDENLYRFIDETLLRYSEEQDIVYEQGSSKSVYDTICDTIDSVLNVINGKSAEVLSGYCAKVKSIASNWYILLIVSLVSLILILAVHFKRIASGIYSAALTLGVSSAFLLAAAHILLEKDYVSKSVLSGGLYGKLIGGVYRSFFGDMKQCFLICFCVTVVLFIASVVLVLCRRGKKDLPAIDTSDNAS